MITMKSKIEDLVLTHCLESISLKKSKEIINDIQVMIDHGKNAKELTKILKEE